MFSSLVHLIPSLSISYPYLIEFHDFADNIQEGIKHQMRGATHMQRTLGFPSRAEPECSLGNDDVLAERWGWCARLVHRSENLPFVFLFSFSRSYLNTHTFWFFLGWVKHKGMWWGLDIFNFLFLVSHLLNHVGTWDLHFVPHWWKKKYIAIHPNPNLIKFILFSTFVYNRKFNQLFVVNQSFKKEHLSPFHEQLRFEGHKLQSFVFWTQILQTLYLRPCGKNPWPKMTQYLCL